MKTPDTNIDGDKRIIGGNNGKKEELTGRTVADFPINESLLLDEVLKKEGKGFEHVQLEADESQQHPEVRGGVKETEETQLDEITEKDSFESPDRD